MNKPKLLDQVRDVIRVKHYSLRTEKAYVHWIKAYIFFHHKRHPAQMGEREISEFLTRLPVVFGKEEVHAILGQLEGTTWLMASLLFGSGLRLMECLRLRVKDVDFGYEHLVVRDGKGHKDRVTPLARVLKEPTLPHRLLLCGQPPPR